MKRKLRGIKRSTFLLDYNLYRVQVPIPGHPGQYLSVIDIHPERVEHTIVFQHGYAGAAESWEYQINHFAPNHRVIVPDLRGHGQSDAPYSQYTMDELVADMHAIARHLKLPDKFHLVGHSFGGSVCVEYANAYPETLEGLVLIATAGEYPLPRAVAYLSRIPTGVFAPLWAYRPRWDAELHVMKRMLLNNLRKWKGWNLLRNISVPTLIITGERDTYFPRFVFDDVGRMVPHAEVYDVGSAKHKVQLERHEAVNRAIDRFVDGDRRARSWRDSRPPAIQSARPWLASYAKDTPATIPIPRRPLYSFLESAAYWKPKGIATHYYGHVLTYQQLNERANQFAHALLALGIGNGDRIIVVLPNCPEIIIAYYGALKIGAVVVLPNPDADAERIMQQAAQTQARLIVTVDAYHRLASALRVYHPELQAVFVTLARLLGDEIYNQIIKSQDPQARDETHLRSIGTLFDDFLQGHSTLNPEHVVDPHAIANINYTSGTTDSPKGVCLTHYNLVANALQTRHWVPDMEYGREVVLSVVPILHSYGMTTAMNVPISMAATMVLLSVFDMTQVLLHIKKHQPTIFPGVPAMYTAINQTPGVRQYGLSSIKACLSGAAPLPVEVQEAFEKLTRGRLVEGYGLTEAAPVTHANPLYGVRKVGTIGVPLPNTDARIIDIVTGDDLPPGKIGELLVRGPQVMKGYWGVKHEDEPESVLKDGWLYTGDIALMDSDGYFQIISRKRDTIMTGSYSVYPRDVEEVIYENNKVLEVAVVGIGQADGEQRVKAFVVPRANTTLSKEELIELCKRRLDEYAVPYDIEFRTELPKSFVGKVLRRLLVEERTT
jgi:long-chain acyl-CoA synthetase